MTYGHAWEYGQTHVDCEDFDTGEQVSIEIPRGTERSDRQSVEAKGRVGLSSSMRKERAAVDSSCCRIEKTLSTPKHRKI